MWDAFSFMSSRVTPGEIITTSLGHHDRTVYSTEHASALLDPSVIALIVVFKSCKVVCTSPLSERIAVEL